MLRASTAEIVHSSKRVSPFECVFRFKFCGGTDLTVVCEKLYRKVFGERKGDGLVCVTRRSERWGAHATKDRPLPKNVVKKYSTWKMGPFTRRPCCTKSVWR